VTGKPPSSLQAFEKNPKNAAILNHLANHFLIVGDYDKVLQLADASFKLNGSAPVRAEACVLIARAYHAQHAFDKAEEFYKFAIYVEKDYALAHHGLAQLRLMGGKTKEALVHFETVLAAYPENLTALKAVSVSSSCELYC